jgi:hypothetical protein
MGIGLFNGGVSTALIMLSCENVIIFGVRPTGNDYKERLLYFASRIEDAIK